jgi:hypothetical protein
MEVDDAHMRVDRGSLALAHSHEKDQQSVSNHDAPGRVASDQPDKQRAHASRSRHVYDLLVIHLVRSPSFPQFLIPVSFLAAFGVIRLVTHGIRGGWLPFGNIEPRAGGLHIHHYLIGIGIALLVGYIQIAFDPQRGRWVLAVFFGIAEALILDEFALLLNLKDVYWQTQGRESIIAVTVGGSLISILWIMRTFIRAVIRDMRGKGW